MNVTRKQSTYLIWKSVKNMKLNPESVYICNIIAVKYPSKAD